MKTALQAALDAKGYDTLTQVQTAVMAPELQGKDLLVSAQTGSGKTLGFGLAISSTLLAEAEAFEEAAAPLALIIAPTRELALQVKRELTWLYAEAGARVASCVGGMDMRDERRALARGAHIVVATPGRLRDHIDRGSIDLMDIRAVVLDEADEMLDLGFREELEFILEQVPAERQTLLFSATVPKMIAELAKNYQRDAIRVETKSEQKQHADITYRAMTVMDRDAENAVINTLRFYEAPNAIVFANTRAMVARLTTRLSNRGFQVVSLSGELSQTERTHALQAMRDGRARVCVATDVAARGIDLPNLDLVVHAELPNNHETLLHRSGRTGRAGRKGVSALIVTRKSRKKAERLLRWAKLEAEWSGAPSADEVSAQDQARMFADPDWTSEPTVTETPLIEALLGTFSAEQVAAAYLRLYNSKHSAPEEIAASDAKPAPRKDFGPSVWFSISGGRNKGAEPRRLLPMLCKLGDLTKDDIGAIRINPDESYVQVLESSVAGFLAAIGPAMTLEEGAKLAQMDSAPVLERGPSRGPREGGRDGYREGRDGRDGGRKPFGKGPRKEGGKPHRGKGKFDKHNTDRDAPRSDRSEKSEFHKPKQDKFSEKPKGSGQKAGKSTPPVAWNDDPAPRHKKPKSSTPKAAPKGGESKPAYGAGPGGSAAPRRRAMAEGALSEAKPSRKSGDKPKGPPPPKGKSNSKKNKARRAAAAAAAPKGKQRG
ncbi:DEAD/DEAH box helicase [Shimia marina]|uniref:ATP-dependent RNA helicase DbpA n=1 Tax=Shimia marina TaxID=321267 RepID=A0A0P1EU28_9RHOB|nr:DEAD/DEAH box helicase [Shimia marina]CUH53897.1 ATP-dependent RNA helicase DbpA [Shimia marina]SFE19959.1 ATP-dependent RNA helicase DeaD [Shimia marina]